MKTIIPFFIFIVISIKAAAFSLTPMVAEIDAARGKTSASFSLQNSTSEDIAIKAEVLQRDESVSGEEVRKPTEEFTLFPQQLVLKAGETRNLRVAYNGPKTVDSEKAFRLVVEQLPVKLAKTPVSTKKVDMKFMISFVASIYVLPEKAKMSAQAQVVDGKLVVENNGNKHFLVKEIASIDIEKQGKVTPLNMQVLKDYLGENILPGKKRTIPLNGEVGIGNDAKLKVQMRESN